MRPAGDQGCLPGVDDSHPPSTSWEEEAERAFEEYEASPEAGLPALKDQLVRHRADQDAEILRAAQLLMARVDPSGMNTGKYRSSS